MGPNWTFVHDASRRARPLLGPFASTTKVALFETHQVKTSPAGSKTGNTEKHVDTIMDNPKNGSWKMDST
jgi:hypothetical protein